MVASPDGSFVYIYLFDIFKVFILNNSAGFNITWLGLESFLSIAVGLW